MIVYSKRTVLVDSDPVSLSEVKSHLEITGDSKNAYITTLITVARELCEAYTGLSFVTQERTMKMDRFPLNGKEIVVPYGPIQSIDTFTYIDTAGVTQNVVVNTGYKLDSHSWLGRLLPIASGQLDEWPDTYDVPNAVNIEYTAGFDDVSGVVFPKVAKQAMLMQIASMFENRQDEVIGSKSFTNILSLSSRMLLDTIKVSWDAYIDRYV